MPYTTTHMAIRIINAVLVLASLAAAGGSEVSAAEGGGAFDARDRRKIGAVTTTTGTQQSGTAELMLPLVVNTWTGDFSKATARAWDVISSAGTDSAVLDAVEQGCKLCEDIQCGGSVGELLRSIPGYGGHPDSEGEVTLDSMVMFGPQHSVGAVACIRRIKNASSVARAVMEHTEHTMLAGEGATAFAKMLGLEEESLDTDASRQVHQSWLQRSCQPNYYRNFDGAGENCPPYPPPPTPTAEEEIMRAGGLGVQQLLRDDESEAAELARAGRTSAWQEARSDPARLQISEDNHDTIGMVVVDERGDLACGTTTNGAANKIAGRVGDSPVAGAGCYVDNDVGGAAATGDGDVMMRFLPSFRAVESMRAGASPQDACAEALCRISRFYPTFGGALVCVNKAGEHGAARHGLSFAYSYQSPEDQGSQIAHAIEVDDDVCERLRAGSSLRWSSAPW